VPKRYYDRDSHSVREAHKTPRLNPFKGNLHSKVVQIIKNFAAEDIW